MTLEKKLACLRKREGLSQAEVSEKLDVSRQAVTKWETGTSRPSIENLQSLSRLYNVPLEYLLDESRDELPAPAPAAPAAEKGPEQTVQKKEKQWIRPLMIGAVVLALLVCFLFWYGRGQKENELDLHLEYGETVTITASYSPASASVDFGLIDSDGVFYPVRGSNGSINQTIRIDLRGTYTFAVRNNSSYKVSVSGFVNY